MHMIRRCGQLAIGILLAGTLGALLASSLVAAGPASAPTSQASDTGPESDRVSASKNASSSSSPGAWWQLLAAMAVVAAMIFALGWILKRLGGGRASAGAGPVRVVARASLTSKHHVFLVRMGRRTVLVGVGPGGMTRLSETSDPVEAGCDDVPKHDMEGGAI